jgi:hypothetical protein
MLREYSRELAKLFHKRAEEIKMEQLQAMGGSP